MAARGNAGRCADLSFANAPDMTGSGAPVEL
jgi:hypothetical protein